MTPAYRELDVRAMLRGGGEPFQAIMEAVGELATGQALKLIATFKPSPLFPIMAGYGFTHSAREIDGGDWEVFFIPQAASSVQAEISADADILQAWPEPKWNLDLTDLDPPEPMARILAKTEQMRSGDVLFALLSREPIFLFAELDRRGHQWIGNFDATGAVFRILVRIGAETQASR